MNGHTFDPDEAHGWIDEELDEFERPFLGGAAAPAPAPARVHDGEDGEDDEDGIRAYLLTGGRTGGGSAGIAMETTAVVTPLGARAVADRAHRFELGQVLQVCSEARSVAEVAALVGVPLGVAQVLVGDLVGRELLITTSTAKSLAFDVNFIERLIAGVAAL